MKLVSVFLANYLFFSFYATISIKYLLTKRKRFCNISYTSCTRTDLNLSVVSEPIQCKQTIKPFLFTILV